MDCKNYYDCGLEHWISGIYVSRFQRSLVDVHKQGEFPTKSWKCPTNYENSPTKPPECPTNSGVSTLPVAISSNIEFARLIGLIRAVDQSIGNAKFHHVYCDNV